jgi:sugar (pentulose or hexulose) kinase
MKDALLAVDIGSTNIKTLLFDEGGREAFSKSVPMKDFYTDDEAKRNVFCDPEVLYSDIAQMIRDIADAAAGRYEVAAVSVTGMGGDALPLDKNGDFLYPFISWKSRRTMDAYRELGSRMGFERYFLVSGLQARPMDTVFKMMWMRENEPEIYSKSDRWLFIEDYIVYRLCGSACTDRSIASISGLYDIANGRWSEEIASYAGLDTAKLPPLAGGGEMVGRVNRHAAGETNLKQGVPVVQGGWDIQCAALAMGAVSKNAVVDTMGTWETVNIIQDKPVLTSEFYRKGFNVCAHVAEGLYTFPVFLLSSGIVEWYLQNNYPRDGEAKRDYSSFLEDIRKSPAGAGGVIFLPHIAGGNFPNVDPCSMGAFAGISEQTKREDFSRAVIEGLTYMSAQVVSECENIIGSRLDTISVTGGGTRNKEWMKIKADVLGRNVFVSKMSEDSARGAAMLAGIGCGMYAGARDAIGRVDVCCEPQEPSPENSLMYSRFLEVYAKLYAALKDINHNISAILNGAPIYK